jgi:hypothetical protein
MRQVPGLRAPPLLQDIEASRAKKAEWKRGYRAAKKDGATATAAAVEDMRHPEQWALYSVELEEPLAKGLALEGLAYWWNGGDVSGCSSMTEVLTVHGAVVRHEQDLLLHAAGGEVGLPRRPVEVAANAAVRPVRAVPQPLLRAIHRL